MKEQWDRERSRRKSIELLLIKKKKEYRTTFFCQITKLFFFLFLSFGTSFRLLPQKLYNLFKAPQLTLTSRRAPDLPLTTLVLITSIRWKRYHLLYGFERLKQ